MKRSSMLFAAAAALMVAGCNGLGYRANQDSNSHDTVVILATPGTFTNATATAVAGDVNGTNGTFSAQGALVVNVFKNVQIYNGGGTAASNDTRFTLEIPATATVPNPSALRVVSSPDRPSNKYASASWPSTNAPPRILAVGDSWASAVVAETQRDEGWPEILGIAPELRQGIDGSTASDWSADKGGCLSRALATPCDRVVLSLGGNDLFDAYADRSISEQEVSTAYAALAQVVTRLQAKFGADNVFVLLYANPYAGRVDASIASAALREFQLAACPPGTRFIDSAASLNSASCWANGDYHPSRIGAQRLAAQIESEVRQ